MTTAKYDYNVYEKRIIYRLVEMCQSTLSGKKLDHKITIDETLFQDRVITMPIALFLTGKDGKKDNNHKRVREALKGLNSKVFEYEDDRIWKTIRIIEKPKFIKYSDMIQFEVQPEIFNTILDFSKGYRKLELQTAMTFVSVYSMRFYELFSGCKTQMEYSIEQLKQMFHIEGKYPMPSDFIKHVVKVAKRELDKKSPYSFNFETKKTGRKITHIKFYPVFIPKNRDTKVEEKSLKRRINLSWSLDLQVIDYLKTNFEFTEKEIKNNLELFAEAEAKTDILYHLSTLKTSSENKANRKGYVIAALRNIINNAD